MSEHEVRLRVFERGAGETLGCGSALALLSLWAGNGKSWRQALGPYARWDAIHRLAGRQE